MLKMWRNGVKREDITLKDMESLIERGAFNEQGMKMKFTVALYILRYKFQFLEGKTS